MFFELFASSWGALFSKLRHLALGDVFTSKTAQAVISVNTQGIHLETLELRHYTADPALLEEVLASWPGLNCITYKGKFDSRLYTLSSRSGRPFMTSQSSTSWDILRSGHIVPLS